MSSLRDRVWAWLTAKPLTRIEIFVFVALVVVGPDIPKHLAVEILRWVILGLTLFLASFVGWIVWTQRGRRK